MRKNLTKITATALALSMAFSMVACSNKDSTKKDENVIVEDEVVTGDRLQADWTKNAVIYEVNVRQYTNEGTFAAFSEHLEDLKDMGVNVLWFMPIYPISQIEKKGSLGSYYAVADYTSVNSEFGTTEEFKELIDKAHDMGFKVVLDWVANHTGWDHTWITEHPEYYSKDDEGNIISPYGTDWIDVADLNYDNADMRSAMIDAMSFWVKDMDVDGFRCDYAQGVPGDFWNEARATLDAIKPIYMVAEDGTESDSMITAAFDSNYNFKLYDSLDRGVSVPGYGDDVEKFIDLDLPYGAFKMNFIDNHDKNYYDGALSNRFGDEKLGALYTIVFTSEGVPLIYSGNEEDTTLQVSFFDKDNMDFGDYTYREMLTRFCHIKTENEPLYNGIYGGNARIIPKDNQSIVAFKRVKNGKQITVVVNLSAKDQEVNYDEKILDGTTLIHGDANGLIATEETEFKADEVNSLSPWEYYIIAQE